MANPVITNPLASENQNTVTSSATTTSSTNSDQVRMTILRTDNKYLKDPLGTRFYEGGVNFKAKLIGQEEVKDARGDDMCRESMIRLKAQVQVSGQHKQRIIINVDINGLRIADEMTGSVLYKHAANHISFLSRDVNDPRAFGYVYGQNDGKYRYFAIKTEKASENLVLTIRDLFQFIYGLKRKQGEEKANADNTTTAAEAGSQKNDQKQQVLAAIADSDLETLQKNIETVDQDFDALALRNDAPTVSQAQENPDDLFAGAIDSTTSPADYAAKSSNIMNLFGPTPASQPGYGAPAGGMFPPQQASYGVQPGFGVVQQPAAFAVQQPVVMGGMQQPMAMGMQPGFAAVPTRPINPNNPFGQPPPTQVTSPFGNSQDPFSMFDSK